VVLVAEGALEVKLNGEPCVKLPVQGFPYIPERIAHDPCFANLVITRIVSMSMNPDLGLLLLDEVFNVVHKVAIERANLESVRYTIVRRKMVRYDDIVFLHRLTKERLVLGGLLWIPLREALDESKVVQPLPVAVCFHVLLEPEASSHEPLPFDSYSVSIEPMELRVGFTILLQQPVDFVRSAVVVFVVSGHVNNVLSPSPEEVQSLEVLGPAHDDIASQHQHIAFRNFLGKGLAAVPMELCVEIRNDTNTH
jgi:hypothetical protein